MLEEAKRRDHRKIGQEMGLFFIDPEYTGPGMPLWLPKGTVLVEELEKLAKETEFAAGYVRVKTPHLAKEKMYKTSGHLPYYEDSMFPPMEVSELQVKVPTDMLPPGILTMLRQRASTKVDVEIDKDDEVLLNAFKKVLPKMPKDISLDAKYEMFINSLPDALQARAEQLGHHELYLSLRRIATADEYPAPEKYYLKAMNCPHHHRIFAAEPRSYRDLPLRLAEYGTCYRYEQSGELFGLMRVRSLNMNDAHIYCTEDQFAAEFNAVNEMYLKYFRIFGIEKYVMRFSTHLNGGLGEKYVNEPKLWLKTEDMVRRVLIDSKINYVEVPDEAAFYGPKIDVQVWSVIGREFTLATNQVDFAVPAKFGLVYRDKDNVDKTPLCIHRAPLGTHERFIGFLIEHYAGNFPLWLAPEQVRVITIGEDEPLLNYAKQIVNELRGHQVRATGDYGSDPMKAKIANAEQAKVHTMLVIGGRDMEAGAVSVRLHGKGNVGAKPKGEVVADILAAIRERKA
jgi:threonyl-tRNA synthetase